MNVNQTDVIAALMAWLEGNIASQSELHFDSEGKVTSEQVYQTLVMKLSTLPPCEALKQHLALSHAMLAQTIHLQRIPCPSAAWQSQLISLVERKASGGLFVSPCTNPEPYREFHYYCDERNTLWALMVVDAEDSLLL